MRKIAYEIKDIYRRLTTIVITVVIGLAFVLAGSAIAAPEDKEVDIKKPEIEVKIEKPDLKSDSKAFFNRNEVFDRNRIFDLKEERPFFNRFFFNPFDFDVDVFDEERD